MGIEQSYLSKLENDQALPSADALENICTVYGVGVQEVLSGLEEQQLRRKPELLALRKLQAARLRGGKRSVGLVRGGFVLVAVLACVGLIFVTAPQSDKVAPVPEHELLSMELEQVDGRQVIEMFAEFGGLKVSGLELVSGEIDRLKLDQVPWDVALAKVAEKLNLRAKISGGYVTLVPLTAELGDVSK